ncbi:protein NLRC3 [Scomber japonicus]|uniref:protein NLRC3 n=1 Tax=Scomber japonicus TaxID=13676 RepID=UPI0023050B20|nr:protein NLRC3 [Scomber japonicus]
MDDSDLMDRVTPSGSSLGDAVSAGGQSEYVEEEEDEDLYYIPERRPSLDLGTSPMDTSQWHYVDQANSPVLSYSSMSSEKSEKMEKIDESLTRGVKHTACGPEQVRERVQSSPLDNFENIQLVRADSYSSCYTLDSDDCENRIPKVRNKEDTVPESPDALVLIHDPNEIRHPSLTVEFTFKAICKTLGMLSDGEMHYFKRILWRRYPQSFNTPPQSMDLLDLVDRLLECYNLEISLKLTKYVLEEIGKKKMVDYLQSLCIRNEVRYDLRQSLKKIYGEMGGDCSKQGEMRSFDDVFTNLNIKSTSDNGPNLEHEVLTIGKLDSNRKEGKQLSVQDLMSKEWLDKTNLRFLLLTGGAGSGKTMAIKKLILDWVEEKSHQHVSFLVPLPFRELKKFEDKQTSLLEIVNELYPETKQLREEDYRSDECLILFVFDGLDEFCEKLDFHNTELLGDPTEITSLNIIMVNLLRGRLLFRDVFMFTSRPLVRRCIPWDTHYDELDLRGFGESDKDEYFKKRFINPDHADRVIAYTKSFKTLRIMCYLPLFCSLVADECENIFRAKGLQAELPRSLTYMYTKLVLALTRQYRVDGAPALSPDEERDCLMKLGKTALTMIEKGQFKLTRCEWKEVGVSDDEAVVNSGLCTQYVTKPFILFQERVISFIHPTMQEYLAALYVFLSFRNHGKNIFEQQLKDRFSRMFKGHKAMEMYKSAVDKSFTYEDGKLDMFLRFLFGMVLHINVDLLKPFCTNSAKWPNMVDDAASLIKKKIKENQFPGRNENLRRCLEELGVST